ncbi:hypothetical protein Ancab_028717 [Ancistrocladus abbreviatus]
MSRCFPYPPPGYAGKCSGNEALILSIKLQREREQAKSDRKKERKREKKEKRREDEKAKGKACSEKTKFPELCHDAGSKTQLKGGSNTIKCEDEPQQLEKSTVTEEHGRPCYSTDSTENSAKRKRPPIPPNSIQGHGNILRIRLSSQNRGVPTGSSTTEQLCSTSGRPESLTRQENRIDRNHYCNPRHSAPRVSTAALHLAPKSDRVVAFLPGRTAVVTSTPAFGLGPMLEMAAAVSGDTPLQPATKPDRVLTSLPESAAAVTSVTLHPAPSPDKVAPPLSDRVAPRSEKVQPALIESTEIVLASQAVSTSSDKKQKGSKSRKLIDNWVPPPLKLELSEPDDLDWLFKTKEQCEPAAKRFKACDDLPCWRSATALQPCAEYLRDVDLCVLPFTVPF